MPCIQSAPARASSARTSLFPPERSGYKPLHYRPLFTGSFYPDRQTPSCSDSSSRMRSRRSLRSSARDRRLPKSSGLNRGGSILDRKALYRPQATTLHEHFGQPPFMRIFPRCEFLLQAANSPRHGPHGAVTRASDSCGWRRKADSGQAESRVVENIEHLGLQLQLQVLSDRELAAKRWIKLDQRIQREDISSQGTELTDKRLSEPRNW